MEFVVQDKTLDALDRLQQSLRDLIESLQASKVQDAGNAPVNGDSPMKGQSPEVPEAPKTTLEEVRMVLAEKSREGKTALVRMLLERFSAHSLSEVDPADYTELLAEGKAL